ncbi:MAG: PstS family phosphate ABC transporter substrate-binding protein [Nostochopsis sp.]
MNTGESNTKENRSNESNGSNNRGTVICGWCSYDANPVEVKHCQNCGKPLVITYANTKDEVRKFKFAPGIGSLALALVLLLVGGGSYFFWQQLQVLTTTSSLNDSPDKAFSDTRLYSSMKEVSNVPEGTFNYGGAKIVAILTAQGTHKAMMQAHPNFHLRYTEPANNNSPGSTAGISMLLNGEVSFALSGKALEDDDYSKAKERGFSLQTVPVAIDGMGLYTHPALHIPGLSVQQLQAIYTGQITNWKEVGGPDLPITIVYLKSASNVTIVLGIEKNNLSSKMEYVRDNTTALRKVAATPGAISFSSATQMVNQRSIRPLAVAPLNSKEYVQLITDDRRINVKALQDNSYPLSRRVFVLIRRDNTPDQAAGVAYSNMLLSKEGQQFIEKAGLVPIRGDK